MRPQLLGMGILAWGSFDRIQRISPPKKILQETDMTANISVFTKGAGIRNLASPSLRGMVQPHTQPRILDLLDFITKSCGIFKL